MAIMFEKISLECEINSKFGNEIDIMWPLDSEKFSIAIKTLPENNSINIFPSKEESLKLVNFIKSSVKNRNLTIKCECSKNCGNKIELNISKDSKKFSISGKNKFKDNIDIFLTKENSIKLIEFIKKRIKNV